MYQRKYFLPVFVLLLTVIACSLPGKVPVKQTPTFDQVLQIATDVPTLVGSLAVSTETSTSEAVLPEMTETQSIQYGIISGSLSYPGEFIPPQRVFAYAVNDFSVYYYIDTVENQSEYQMGVPAGTYFIVSYLIGDSLSAGYSQMVPCGLQAGCDDHSLIPIEVTAGNTAAGVDPGDWYAPAGTFPLRP